MPELTIAETAELARAAIERIEDAHRFWRAEEQRPDASQAERFDAWAKVCGFVSDLGWQWGNIERLLDYWQDREKELGEGTESGRQDG